MEFSADDRLFLEETCRYFHTHGKWPTYDYLDRTLTADHENLDVEEIGYRLEPFMIDGPYAPVGGWDPQRQAFLNISALSTCVREGIYPEVTEDLDAFMVVCSLAIEKYNQRDHDSPINPQISSDELRDGFGMSDLMLRKVYALVGQTNLINGSSYRDATNDQPAWWSFSISAEVRRYRRVATIDDFIQAREKARRKQSLRYPSGEIVFTQPYPEDLYLTPTPSVTTSDPAVQLRPISLFPSGPFSRNEHLCFVLMPFAEDLWAVYTDAIVPAASDIGLECQRADEIMRPGGVMAQVWQALVEARVVVADLTGMNPNVFYELGLAHTIGHDVIMLTQDKQWVPFDLQHMRWFKYQPDAHGLKLLLQDLRRAFQEVLVETTSPDK